MTPDGDLATPEIDRDHGVLVHHAVVFDAAQAGPPQEGLHPRQELGEVERLRHVVVRAQREAANLIALLIARREHHDWDQRELSQLPDDLPTVNGREHQVHDHQVWGELRKEGDACLALEGLQHPVAGLSKAEGEELIDRTVVFHDEDGGLLLSSPGRAPLGHVEGGFLWEISHGSRVDSVYRHCTHPFSPPYHTGRGYMATEKAFPLRRCAEGKAWLDSLPLPPAAR